MRSRLPFRVTVLTWTVLILTGWNAVRLWAGIAWKARLAEFVSRPSPLYIGVTGVLWTALGLSVIWAIWQHRRGARRFIFTGAVIYTTWYWADRLLLQQERSNWPFTAALNLLLLIYVFFSTKSGYFQREDYEREHQN